MHFNTILTINELLAKEKQKGNSSTGFESSFSSEENVAQY